MRVVNQSFEILTEISPNGEKELRLIETAGRTCYKSESADFEKCKRFVHSLIKCNHCSVLEHSTLTVKFITSRAITHQLVRHRLCAFSQESQRYCNYSQGKFDNEITFVLPIGLKEDELIAWQNSCKRAEYEYMQAISKGQKPEIARSILPNCVKSEIVMTTNYREWRHIFKERTHPAADPNMQALMKLLLMRLKDDIPVVFDDILI